MLTKIVTLLRNQNVLFPVELRPLKNQFEQVAWLHESGIIHFLGKEYLDPEDAMKAYCQDDVNWQQVFCSKSFSSTGWQFWGWFSEERQTWTPIEHLRAMVEPIKESSGIKTSQSHPLRVDWVLTENENIDRVFGNIGMTFCPGKKGDGLYGGHWQRDLKADLSRLVEIDKAQVLVSLIEQHEFELLGVSNFSSELQAFPIKWIHLPIKDMGIPDERFELGWKTIKPELDSMLLNNKRIVFHCRGGLGRTGMIAARMLIEHGIDSVEAIRIVRLSRERSIETFSQEEYLLERRWGKYSSSRS